MICPSCGQSGNGRFCATCGAPLVDAQAETLAVTPATAEQTQVIAANGPQPTPVGNSLTSYSDRLSILIQRTHSCYRQYNISNIKLLIH